MKNNNRTEALKTAEVVEHFLDETLTWVVGQLIGQGLNVSDRGIMTGISSLFMRSLAVTVPPEHWDDYLGSLLNEPMRENMRKMHEAGHREVDEALEQLGVATADEAFDIIRTKMTGSPGAN